TKGYGGGEKHGAPLRESSQAGSAFGGRTTIPSGPTSHLGPTHRLADTADTKHDRCQFHGAERGCPVGRARNACRSVAFVLEKTSGARLDFARRRFLQPANL